jgi:hypothetical protein
VRGRAELNEFGEVILPNDPQDGLPIKLLRVVEAFALVPEEDESLSRLHLLADLLHEWLDVQGNGKASRLWASRHAQLLYPLRGSDPEPPGLVPAEAISGEVLGAMIRGILLVRQADRTLRWECLRDIVLEWRRLVSDAEKLLGHLLLTHKEPAETVTLGTSGWIVRHADIHRELRLRSRERSARG